MILYFFAYIDVSGTGKVARIRLFFASSFCKICAKKLKR